MCSVKVADSSRGRVQDFENGNTKTDLTQTRNNIRIVQRIEGIRKTLIQNRHVEALERGPRIHRHNQSARRINQRQIQKPKVNRHKKQQRRRPNRFQIRYREDIVSEREHALDVFETGILFSELVPEVLDEACSDADCECAFDEGDEDEGDGCDPGLGDADFFD